MISKDGRTMIMTMVGRGVGWAPRTRYPTQLTLPDRKTLVVPIVLYTG